MVNWVTNLELFTDKVKYTFVKFDAEIHLGLRAQNRVYEGSKTSTLYWSYMLEESPVFAEEFKRELNNAGILEAENFTPEVLEDKCVDMENNNN